MNTELKEFKLDNNETIIVEMATMKDEFKFSNGNAKISDVPEGAELISASTNMNDSVSMLKSNIKNVANIVFESFQSNLPSEWTVEMNIGFKGTTSPIPFIVSGEMNGALKIKATWKKE